MTNSTLLSLNSEWAELVAGTDAAVSGWAQCCPELAGAANLDQVLALAWSAPDAVLGALLRLGADGDTLARRAVLQAMLGKAVRLSGGRDERLAEAVSELWVAIAEYPLGRRPRSIAVNLAWTLHRRLARPKTVAAPIESAGPTAEGTLAQAHALGLIDDRAHRTLWLVYVAGLTSAKAAVELGTTPELVRYRCSRSLRRLASQAELLAA